MRPALKAYIKEINVKKIVETCVIYIKKCQ
jgi:hypothetical protein